jgi:hypothetical protein
MPRMPEMNDVMTTDIAMTMKARVEGMGKLKPLPLDGGEVGERVVVNQQPNK